MKPSGAALAMASASVLWLLAVAWPLSSVAWAARGGTVPASFEGPAVAGTTVAWSLGVALLAAPIGWLAGRSMRGGRAAGLLVCASVLAAVLPPYAVFWAWWQALGPGTEIGDWAARTDRAEALRLVLLGIGLVSWAWPLSAWCVVAHHGGHEADARELEQVDRAGWRHRLARAWRTDWPGLAVGAALTVFVVAGSTIAFDLAQVRTWGFELRTLDATGTPVGGVVRAAMPAMLMACAGAAIVAWWPIRPAPEGVRGPAPRVPWAALGAVTLCVALPVVLLVLAIARQGVWQSFGTVALRGSTGTLLAAAAAGGLAAIVAVGHLSAASLGASPFASARRWRAAERVALAGWVCAALVPGTVYALGVIVGFNRAGWLWVYDTPVVVVLAELGRFGAVAAWIGRLAAWREPEERRALRAVDGAAHRGLVRALGPEARSAAAASALLVAALGAGDVVVAGRVEPPGWAWIGSSLLNAIHYQQPDAVLGALLAMVALAALAAVVVSVGWSRVRRAALGAARGGLGVALMAASVFALTACSEQTGPPGALPAHHTIGAAGRGGGRFQYPRVLDVDPRDGTVLVIDRQARVHRFSPEGPFLGGWEMPEHAMGKPTGMGVGPDGTIWVADTHYHRVIAFDPGGREVRRWGGYGKEPGQFVFPCDVAVGPDGLVYVAEFGGNDRIQVFTQQGEFVRQFGSHGAGVGQFDRPQSLAFLPGGDLLVADACNHRLQVCSPEGEVRRTLGELGREPGQFVYPYGLWTLPDGSVLVSEFGGNRVQRIRPDTGEPVELWNQVTGVPLPVAAFVIDGDSVRPIEAHGNELRFPWAAAWSQDRLFILDSGHARVVVAPLAIHPSGSVPKVTRP